MEARQALAKARETGERRLASPPGVMRPLRVDAGAEAQRLAPGVEPEDLVAFDAADLEAEAVRSEVDDGERLGGHAIRALFSAGIRRDEKQCAQA